MKRVTLKFSALPNALKKWRKAAAIKSRVSEQRKIEALLRRELAL